MLSINPPNQETWKLFYKECLKEKLYIGAKKMTKESGTIKEWKVPDFIKSDFYCDRIKVYIIEGGKYDGRP